MVSSRPSMISCLVAMVPPSSAADCRGFGWVAAGAASGVGVEEAGRRRHARALLGLEAVADQLRLQGVEQAKDVLRRRAEAHEADAPDRPLEGAEAAADLDVVLLQEAAP